MEKDENKKKLDENGNEKPTIEQQHSGIGHNVGGNLEITNNYNIIQEQTRKPCPKRLNAIGYAMPERTLGRDGDVERLHQLLQREGAAVVMNGMGGIGKTTTAIYYAQRHEADYAHIIWLKSGGNVWDTLLFDGELLHALDIEQGINSLLQG